MKSFARLALFISVAVAQTTSPIYGQCGGTGWTGPTTCASGSVCTVVSGPYSQCLPGTASTSSVPPTSTPGTGTTTTKTTTTKTTTSPSSTPTLPTGGKGKVKYAGINISGFDFGCGADGTCNVSGAWPPLLTSYGADGIGQMQHFVKDDGFNLFRLPVSWQYLLNGVLGGPLNTTLLATYDILVNACLATGAYCIVDMHNYARWNGLIIGQGGPTNAQFADVWGQIAAHYKNQTRIIFGTMNEPHDVPSISLWAQSVQAAVTAIRKAGATTQMILLPGNNWTSAQTYVSNGSADALGNVTNPDGSTTNLIFEVHKYSDADNSGTTTDCVTNNIDIAFAPLATYVRAKKRLVLNTEFGGGQGQDCITDIGQQLAYLNQNSDVYLGWTGWAAGNFPPQYALGETPTDTNGVWTDTPLVAKALVPAFKS